MKICLVGKYPPIQGGVSRQNFWLTRALAQQGHEVHVVTNAQEVEDAYRIPDLGPGDYCPAPPPAPPPGLTIHSLQPRSEHRYIPWANPFVTRLASMATEVVREAGCDLLWGYYLEPYGVSAYLAAQWCGTPFGLRHAGSDIGRLFHAPDLGPAYTEILLAADFVVSTPRAEPLFCELGVDPDRLFRLPPPELPSDYFHPGAPPLDIERLLQAVRENLSPDFGGGAYARLARKPFAPGRPTVGIYGKVGETKGSFDLLQALGRLAKDGVEFNFLALTQGKAEEIAAFERAVSELSLSGRTWLLPFLPHWQIPSFIRACTAVCFLEREFAVPGHIPWVPREVLACAGCLVLSREISGRQLPALGGGDGESLFVADPRDTAELAAVLRRALADPARSAEVGRSGHRLLQERTAPHVNESTAAVTLFRQVLRDAARRRGFMSVPEMQAYLARLYVDTSFRRLAQVDPAAARSEYKLTAEECQSLDELDSDGVEYFALSLRMKRRRRFGAAYPLLFKHLPANELGRLFDRFYQLHPDHPLESLPLQLQKFGRFMEETLSGDPDLPAWTADLARYERLTLAVQGAEAQPAADALSAETPKSALSLQSRPRVAPAAHLARFGHDMPRLVKALHSGDPTEPYSAPGACFLFLPNAGQRRVRVLRPDPETPRLLELCDGRRTVAEIAAAYESATGESGLQDEILEGLKSLWEQGVVVA